MKPLTEIWIDEAEKDMELRCLALQAKGDRLAGRAAFCAQQATEKYLKAWLFEADVLPTQTHELAALVK